MSNKPFIHKQSDVQTDSVGPGTRIWQYVAILSGARIGADCNICAHCLIEGDVIIGDRVTIKSGVYVWDGARIGNDVFIGPNVTFTNDKFPRSKRYPESFSKIVIEDNASVGAAAVLLPGIVVGRGAMIGAGAVVTKSVPPFAIVAGSPARITGYVESSTALSTTGTQAAPLAPSVGEALPVGVGRVTIHKFKVVRDMRGEMSVGEFLRDIPFEPKRYFLVYSVPSEKTRGEHAHRECHQFLICVRGSCSVVVDDGSVRREVRLDSPATGLYLPPLTWGVQYKYSPDAVLLVFASHYYEGEDYIRDYSEFIELVNQRAV